MAVMQIHPGSKRNHSNKIFNQFGSDKGFDIPGATDYVSALKPLLDEVGLRTDLTIILFTLDETSILGNWLDGRCLSNSKAWPALVVF